MDEEQSLSLGEQNTGVAEQSLSLAEDEGQGQSSTLPDLPVENIETTPDGPGIPPQEEQKEGVNLLEEASAVVGGGAIDAVESVGGFAELTGDTLKTGLGQLFGQDVDATQNPFESEGTFVLPEAQLDRFLLHTKVNYPNKDIE